MYLKAKILVEQYAYDINHTHFIVPSGIVSYWLHKSTSLPYIITAHGSDVPGYNPDRFYLAHFLIKMLWKRILDNSQSIICPSNYLKQMILDRTDHAYCEIIPNGYTPGVAKPVNFEGKKNTVLVVTRMFKRKGVQFLINALRDIKTDWEILIVGDGPYLGKLKKLATAVEAKINFLGFLDRKELDAIYEKAKIFVFPSIRENYPMVLIESMEAGCAVITTNSNGCCEVVADAAIKTDPGNIDQLRDALTHLLNNESEIMRFGKKARKRADQLTWRQIARQTDAVFCEAIASLEQGANIESCLSGYKKS
jgi:glycosyltransferase involved in cell wall biosynthesis